jgi:hypothetical protein
LIISVWRDGAKGEGRIPAVEYPHWMMVAGAVLVALGFISFAFRQNRNVEPDHESTEMKAKEK